MLLNLHVRNIALLDEVEIDFTKGLNILSGETGAGKSLIMMPTRQLRIRHIVLRRLQRLLTE